MRGQLDRCHGQQDVAPPGMRARMASSGVAPSGMRATRCGFVRDANKDEDSSAGRGGGTPRAAAGAAGGAGWGAAELQMQQ